MNEFKKLMNDKKWELIIRLLVSLAIGVIFIVKPDTSKEFICKLLGILMIAGGVLGTLRYIAGKDKSEISYLSGGIVILVCGIFFVCYVKAVSDLMVVILGLLIVVSGARTLADGVLCKRAGSGKGIALMLLAVITLALGVLTMFGVIAGMIFVGISLIVSCLMDLVQFLVFRKTVASSMEALKSVVEQ